MNKKIGILISLAIIITSTIFILNNKYTLSPEPPSPISSSKLDDITSETDIFIPITISNNFISKAVENTVPRSLEERHGISIGGVKDEHVIVKAKRGVLKTIQDTSGLSTSTSVNISASVKGKVRPIGPRFSQTARGTINFTLKTKPEFQNNWKIKPNVMLNYSVPKMETELGGVFKVSLRGQTKKALDKVVNKQLNKLNNNFPGNTEFKTEASKLWNKAHAVISVSSSPQAWVVTKPLKMKVMQPEFDTKHMKLGLGLTLSNKLVISDYEPTVELSAFPETLEIIKSPNENNILISLPIISDLKSLNSSIKSELEAKPIKFETEAAGESMTGEINNLSLTPSGSGVIIEADINTQSGGLFGDKASGKIYLQGTPELDNSTNILSFSNLDYHANTKSALLNNASYLLKPIVLIALKNEIKVDLRQKKT